MGQKWKDGAAPAGPLLLTRVIDAKVEGGVVMIYVMSGDVEITLACGPKVAITGVEAVVAAMREGILEPLAHHARKVSKLGFS